METQSVATQEIPKEPKVEAPTKETKAVDMSKITPHQAELLKALADEIQNNDRWWRMLGNIQRQTYYSTRDMFGLPNALQVLNVQGEEFWRNEEVPGQKKKEPRRFLKFFWDFYVPGTNAKLHVEKEWRYEDFTP